QIPCLFSVRKPHIVDGSSRFQAFLSGQRMFSVLSDSRLGDQTQEKKNPLRVPGLIIRKENMLHRAMPCFETGGGEVHQIIELGISDTII
ncbi:hypothetical protein ACJX0J_038926, partial [Zea mays]